MFLKSIKMCLMSILALFLIIFSCGGCSSSAGKETSGTDDTFRGTGLSGFGISREGHIYYSHFEDSSKIYSMTPGKNDDKKINEDSSSIENVSGDWVFYNNNSHSGKLYRMKLDGTERKKLSEHGGRYISLTDQWLYYIDDHDSSIEGGSLIKMNMDGTKRTKLIEDHVKEISVLDQWIYYVNGSQGEKLYRVSVEGEGETALSAGMVNQIRATKSGIYYIDQYQDMGRIYRVNSEGTERHKVTDDYATSMSVDDGEWIYYTSKEILAGDPFGSLFKIKNDGTGRKSLVKDAYSCYVEVCGQWVYYIRSGISGGDARVDSDRLFRVNIDGKGKRLIK